MSFADDSIEQALDVAADAILRRANILDGQDPHVAYLLRLMVTNMDMSLCGSIEKRRKKLTRAAAQRAVREIQARKKGRAA